MRVLITGSNGFIGKNLSVRLSEMREFDVSTFTRGESREALKIKVNHADAVVHLAGVNRPSDPAEFVSGNAELTETLCQSIRDSGRTIPLLRQQRLIPTAAQKSRLKWLPYSSRKTQVTLSRFFDCPMFSASGASPITTLLSPLFVITSPIIYRYRLAMLLGYYISSTSMMS
jgi:hypothetical protein